MQDGAHDHDAYGEWCTASYFKNAIPTLYSFY
jgi:hypothetical protein